MHRCLTRPDGNDVAVPSHCVNHVYEVIEKIEPPEADEVCVVVDGQAPTQSSVDLFLDSIGWNNKMLGSQ